MKPSLFCLIVALGAVSAAFAAGAPRNLKDAPGRATVENLCAGCHSLDYIRINAPFLDRQSWTAEVTKMVGTFGAPIGADDTKTIIDYLAANYSATAQPASGG